ncbi:MAG: hypothetical protein BMS9Abin05_0538 [Rhodothermia bacterium]|nr:MAG: hypothetical protein BMS9Abin05_0538 [Rhodothermia bacterium]
MKLLRTVVLTTLLSIWTLSATAQEEHEEHHKQKTEVDTSEQQGAMKMMQPESGQGMMKMMQPESGQSMMQSGAMKNMHETHMRSMVQAMNDPFKRSAMLIRVLPSMKDLLALTDDQVTSSEKASQNYQEQKAAINDDLETVGNKIESLLASNEADPKTVRTLLRESANYRADLQALAFETASRMKATLTDEQRENLAEMTPMQMNHFIMMRMTMMEMMKIMGGHAKS